MQIITTPPLPLLLAVLVMGLGQTTLFALLPLLQQQSGLSLASITTAFAIGSGLFLLGTPLWARLPPRLGRSRVLALALAGFAISHALLCWQLAQGASWQWQETALLLGRVLYGLTACALVPTSQAWLADSTPPAQRLAAMSRLSAGLTLGRLLGPLLAAASLWLGTLAPFWLLALAPLPALLVLRHAVPPDCTASATQPAPQRWQPLLRWLALALLMQLAMGQVQYAIGPWLALRQGLDAVTVATQLGGLLTLCGVVMLCLQLWLLPRCRPGRGLLLTGAGALLAAGAAFALLDGSAGCALAFVLLAIAAALLVPGYTTQATLSSDNQSATAAALATVHTTGFALSAALAGPLFGLWPAAPFWLAAACGGAALLLACLPASRSPVSSTHH